MHEIRIINVSDTTIDDLCQICVPPEKRSDPAFLMGIEQKKIWALEMQQSWGRFAKIAYEGSTPTGQIQYKPFPAYRIVYIYCIYVPDRPHWGKGIAHKLLSDLIEDIRKPQIWFDDQPALALVTKTFPGGKPGQYDARSFFTGRGFQQVGEDRDYLYYPLVNGVIAPTEGEMGKEFF